jgi:transaldolase
MKLDYKIDKSIHDFILRNFNDPHPKSQKRETNGIWKRLRDLGTNLWLDSGDIEGIGPLWTEEFTALTTNNTLLNAEIQKGRYDFLIREADALLRRYQLPRKTHKLELAFILNAYHGMVLTQKYDAFVSVELHTDLANEVETTVDVARRFHRLCPQKFIIKIPFTPAGILATRRLSREGIAVNLTLGFSARQNYLVARISQPAFVNVFLGRINSFIINNGIGLNGYAGEKATMASQAAVESLRREMGITTRQIAASIRDPEQIGLLAGVDVITIPLKVAARFIQATPNIADIIDRSDTIYTVATDSKNDLEAYRFDTLWQIDEALIDCIDILEHENLDQLSTDRFVSIFKRSGCADLFIDWNDDQLQTSLLEGKIPKVENWRDALTSKAIGLDALLNLAGFCSFSSDQAAMDKRIQNALPR